MRKFYTISITMLLILCTLCSCKKSSTQTTSDAGSGDPATVSESSADLTTDALLHLPTGEYDVSTLGGPVECPADLGSNTKSITARVVDQLAVEFTNQGDKTWIFGEYYNIQVLLDGTWYYCNTIDGVLVHDLAHELQPGQSTTLYYSLAPYGTLLSGHFRICCGYGGEGDHSNICYAEFDVTDTGELIWPA